MRKRAREIEFNVDAYTARLIGRENVSKLEGAVLEIVKNAYDADAHVFCLYNCRVLNKICIIDDGCGMTEDIIKKALDDNRQFLEKAQLCYCWEENTDRCQGNR